MRVIAGLWRGRKLTAPAGPDLRPTTDRVKEAMFNILCDEVPGSVCLDLFCGGGGLGIEALSRGAGRCVFVDSSARALTAVRANLGACGADPKTFELVRRDARAFLGAFLAGPLPERWLLVCDPPYASGEADAILSMVPDLATGPGFLAAVVEFGAEAEPLSLPAGVEVRRYGGTRLAIFRPRPD